MKTRQIPALALIAVASLSACTPSPSATPSVVGTTSTDETSATSPASTPTIRETASASAADQTPQSADTQASTSADPVTTTSATPASPTAEDFKTYKNARYGYQVSYPQWMAKTEADNGEGIKVTAPTGGEMLTWTEQTPDAFAGELQTLKDSWAADGVTITSARDLGDKGVHLVATQAGKTLERRYMFGEVEGTPTMAVVQWTYDTTLKGKYATVVDVTCDSLTAPKI